MNTESIVCSQCGAPLSIPSGVSFVSCNHCRAQLAVHRDQSVSYTEVIQKLSEQTDQIAEQLADLRYERELERIDREWEIERDSLLATSKHGGKHVPNRTAGIVTAIVSCGIGLFFSLFSAGIGAPGMFPIFGLVFAAFGVFAAFSTFAKASAYERAEFEYQRRRSAVRRREPTEAQP